MRALHDVWQRTHAAARLQAEQVAGAGADVHAADVNVADARRALSAAEKYRLQRSFAKRRLVRALGGNERSLCSAG